MLTPAPHPELILLARRCYVTTSLPPRANALAIAHGRVIAAGPRRSVLRLRGRGTRVVDLGNAVLTPGIVDCHTHFFYWALGRSLVIDLSALHSLNAMLRVLHTGARRRRVGDWVLARGLDANRWDGRLPCAADLDAAVPDVPLMAHSRDGHTVCLNTIALRRANITARTPDPKGGRYWRDGRGRPTGIVQESAINSLPDPLRDFARRTDEAAQRAIDRALAKAYEVAHAHGVVAVHAMDDSASLFHLQRQHAQRRLGLRVVHAIPLGNFDRARELGLRSGFGDNWLRIGGIKIFADGALGSQTAYMFDPYPGRAGYCGIPVAAQEELRSTVRELAQHGWAAWIHAIGDRAVHEAVGAIVAAGRTETAGIPHRIEHAQCIRRPDMRRMARAGIVASVQPCHVLGDIPIADRHWPQARRHAFPLRSLLDAGVMLACGSDVPIEAIDPRRSLFAAVTRTDECGQPAGGWYPRQRLRAHEVIGAFTRGAAAAAGLPPPAGTLAPGAPADLTIWAADPLRARPDELLHLGILGCAIDGQLHLTSDS